MAHSKLDHPLLKKQVDFDRLLVMMEFGSSVYGTALPTSDTDFKGVLLPRGRDIVLGRAPSTINIHTNDSGSGKRNTAEDVDAELFSLYRYLELLSQGQTNALDMLFCPDTQTHIRTAAWDFIIKNKEKFLNKKCNAAVGYAQSQADKYSLRGWRIQALEYVLDHLLVEYVENPHRPLGESFGYQKLIAGLSDLSPKISDYIKCGFRLAPHVQAGKIEYISVCGKEAGLSASVKFAYEVYKNSLGEYGDRARAAKDGGADWKAMYHAVRIPEQTVELLETSHITFPRPEAPYLLQVRRGERSVEEVSAKIEEGVIRVREAQEKSALPERSDTKFIEDTVYNLYLEEIKSEKI